MSNFSNSSQNKVASAAINSKGRIIIPPKVRHHLGLSTSGHVTFVIKSSGEVKLIRPKYPNIQSLRGVAGSLRIHQSYVKEMIKDAQKERLFKKYGR